MPHIVHTEPSRRRAPDRRLKGVCVDPRGCCACRIRSPFRRGRRRRSPPEKSNYDQSGTSAASPSISLPASTPSQPTARSGHRPPCPAWSSVQPTYSNTRRPPPRGRRRRMAARRCKNDPSRAQPERGALSHIVRADSPVRLAHIAGLETLIRPRPARVKLDPL
jgi:hypothetical protein